MAALVDPSLDILLNTLRPGRRHVKPEVQLRAAFDVLDRNGLTATEDPVPQPNTARTCFANLSDEEIFAAIA